MKRICALLLALLLTAALCACGAEEVPPAAAETPPAEEPSPVPLPTPAPVNEAFVGLWAAPLDCIELLQLSSPGNAAMFGSEPAYAELLLELREDGGYCTWLDYAPAIPALRDGMFRYIEAKSGKTIEEVAAEHEMRADDLLDLYISEAALRELLGDPAAHSGSFLTDGETALLDQGVEHTLTLRDDCLHMQDREFGELIFTRK